MQKEELEIRIANEKIAKPKLTEEKIKHFLYRFRVLDMTKKKHRQLSKKIFLVGADHENSRVYFGKSAGVRRLFADVFV